MSQEHRYDVDDYIDTAVMELNGGLAIPGVTCARDDTTAMAAEEDILRAQRSVAEVRKSTTRNARLLQGLASRRVVPRQ